jgi:5,10-methenyltetrahydrofolate synthetase
MTPDALPSPPGKDELRREMRRRLRAINPAQRAAASLVICEEAAALPAFRDAKTVALFASLPTEPDLHPLIEEAWAQKKRVALPRMFREGDVPHLDWHGVTTWEEVIETGPFGLRGPDHQLCPRIEIAELDCAFAPGLAFDSTGLRLGRGGGYYDFFLGQVPKTLSRFGLMFACQHVKKLPRDPHDQALPAIVTEDGLVSFTVS